MMSAKFLGFLTPSPLVCILDQFIVPNPRTLPYYICFWGTPLLLQTSYVHAPILILRDRSSSLRSFASRPFMASRVSSIFLPTQHRLSAEYSSPSMAPTSALDMQPFSTLTSRPSAESSDFLATSVTWTNAEPKFTLCPYRYGLKGRNAVPDWNF